MLNDNKNDVVENDLAVQEVSQGEDVLLGARMPSRLDVPFELIRVQPNASAAFSLACSASGLSDKEIYTDLGIDQGYFSKIKSGQATLSDDKKPLFSKIVGNNVLLEYIAYQHGYGIVMNKSEAERQLEEAQQQIAERDLKITVLMDAIRGKVSA
jgi:hypothetical protein